MTYQVNQLHQASSRTPIGRGTRLKSGSVRVRVPGRVRRYTWISGHRKSVTGSFTVGGKVRNQDSAARSDPTVPIKITHVRGFESEAENGLTQ